MTLRRFTLRLGVSIPLSVVKSSPMSAKSLTCLEALELSAVLLDLRLEELAHPRVLEERVASSATPRPWSRAHFFTASTFATTSATLYGLLSP